MKGDVSEDLVLNLVCVLVNHGPWSGIRLHRNMKEKISEKKGLN